MDIVPGLGQLIPDWAWWALGPFVVALLMANWVFWIRDKRSSRRHAIRTPRP
jgi:hypothetical protein